MDFSLESLRDAFMDAEFKWSKRGRELYAILLATSLDEAFLLEYLSFYYELDSLTGDRVLVIGPRVRGHPGLSPIPFLSEDIQEFARVGPLDYSQVWRDLGQRYFDEAATDWRTFVQDQTRESYALARFLGIPFNSMPLLVFFDNLDSPQDRVYWSLRGKSGADFVLDLRDLLQAVSDECGWGIRDRVKGLEERAAALRGVPYEIREERKAYREAQAHFHRVSVITAYYEQVAALRCAYEQARADTELKVPLESVSSPIASLEAGRIYGDELSRLRKHHRRWSTRLPTDYREALRRLSYPDREYVEVREGQLALTRDEAVREARRLEEHLHELEEHLHELEDAFESKRSRLVTKAEGDLAKAREYESIPRPFPLKVIQNVLCEAAITIDEPTKSTSVRSIIESEPRRVPAVFIVAIQPEWRHAGSVAGYSA
jgi:hypothetical protein